MVLLKKPAAPTQKPQAVEDNTNLSASRVDVVLSELQGNTFACRTDSGADEKVISDTILKLLPGKAFFPSNNSRGENIHDGRWSCCAESGTGSDQSGAQTSCRKVSSEELMYAHCS